MLGSNGTKHLMIARNLGLEVEKHPRSTEHVKTRNGKAMRSWYLIKRNTNSNVTPHAKVHLYRAMICSFLIFASECWHLNWGDYQMIETFNKKILRWISGMHDYREAMIASNLLPALCLEVLKFLF